MLPTVFKDQNCVTAAAWENSVVNCLLKKLSHSAAGTKSPPRGRKEEREFLVTSWYLKLGVLKGWPPSQQHQHHRGTWTQTPVLAPGPAQTL